MVTLSPSTCSGRSFSSVSNCCARGLDTVKLLKNGPKVPPAAVRRQTRVVSVVYESVTERGGVTRAPSVSAAVGGGPPQPRRLTVRGSSGDGGGGRGRRTARPAVVNGAVARYFNSSAG